MTDPNQQEQHSAHVLGDRGEGENATAGPRHPEVGAKIEVPHIRIEQTDQALTLNVMGVGQGTLTAVDERTRAWTGLDMNDLEPHVWPFVWALLAMFEEKHGEWEREQRHSVEPIVEQSSTPTPGSES
jgi:hypothetical protein